ncbi:MAG: hypothetical protein ACLP4V_18420 [Methylocella sp.]
MTEHSSEPSTIDASPTGDGGVSVARDAKSAQTDPGPRPASPEAIADYLAKTY